MPEARFDGVGRIKGIYASLFCVLRRWCLSCGILQETFVLAKLLFFFLNDFVFNSKVKCSNGLGREIVFLLFPNTYLCFFPSSTLSLVVLLSDILTIPKLFLLFKDCDTDSFDMLCQSVTCSH